MKSYRSAICRQKEMVPFGGKREERDIWMNYGKRGRVNVKR